MFGSLQYLRLGHDAHRCFKRFNRFKTPSLKNSGAQVALQIVQQAMTALTINTVDIIQRLPDSGLL